MNDQLHVVLGGAGATGRALIRELQAKGLPVRAVERTKTVAGVETRHAELRDQASLGAAIAGASHVYLCVGIPYRSETWEAEWPAVMESTIAASAAAKAKLIFFDNIYMYGPAPLAQPFDEDHRQDPASRKGAVRKVIAEQLLAAHAAGTVEALIARSADFYGIGAVNSLLSIVFLENMLQGKAPQWLGAPGVPHTYAYTEDNARAMLRLALDPAAYGQAWHLPVGKAVTPEQVVAIFNKLRGTTYSISFLPPFLLPLISLFAPPVKESREMMYQFTQPYVMSWQKFATAYPDFAVTPYEQGVAAMVQSFEGANSAKANLY